MVQVEDAGGEHVRSRLHQRVIDYGMGVSDGIIRTLGGDRSDRGEPVERHSGAIVLRPVLERRPGPGPQSQRLGEARRPELPQEASVAILLDQGNVGFRVVQPVGDVVVERHDEAEYGNRPVNPPCR